MNNLIKGYFEDYTKNYIMMNGVPTSPFGVTLAKRCKWCYSVMYPQIPDKNTKDINYLKPNKNLSVMRQTFCSKDCQDEYNDWSYFKGLRYQRERMQKIYAHRRLKD